MCAAARCSVARVAVWKRCRVARCSVEALPRGALQCGSVAARRALQCGADVQPHYNPAPLSHAATLQPRPVRAGGARPACECRGLRVCHRRDLCARGRLCVGLGLRVGPRRASWGRRGTRKRPVQRRCVRGVRFVVCVCRGWAGVWVGGWSSWWGGAGCVERRVSRAEAHVLLSSTACQISAFEWCVDPCLVRARRLQGLRAGCRGCEGVRVGGGGWRWA